MLTDIIEGMGKQFGESCEFVVHDYSKDFDSSIVAICNGELTGRRVGMGGTDIGLRVLQALDEPEGRFNYITQTPDGRFLRSSTIYIKDDNQKPIGSLCINLDITEMITAQSYLQKFINMPQEPNPQVEAVIFDNIEDMLIAMIQDSINYVGVPVAKMTREQKVAGIQYLNKRGAMRIKNASNIIAQYYDVSKYTIYNYINGSEDK